MTICNTLHHTVTRCNTLQHTATHCQKAPCRRDDPDLPHCIAPQHTAEHCNTHATVTHMQNTASHCITLHRTASHCITLHHTASHCITQYTTGVTIQIFRFAGVSQESSHVSLYGPDAMTFGGTGLWIQSASMLQMTAVRGIVPDFVAVCVAVCVAVWYVYNMTHCGDTATHCNTLQHTAPLQHTATVARDRPGAGGYRCIRHCQGPRPALGP